MQDSLLSRFDLLFIVLDQVRLTSCILSLYFLNFLTHHIFRLQSFIDITNIKLFPVTFVFFLSTYGRQQQ